MTQPTDDDPATPPNNQMDALMAKLNELQGQISNPQQPQTKPAPREITPPPVPNPKNAEGVQQLAQYANEQARRVAQLELAIEFGLKPEDLDGPYSNPQEMRLAAQVKVLEKQVQQSTSQVADLVKNPPVQQQQPPTNPQPNTGGPSRRVTESERQTKINELRTEANKPENRRKQKGVWLTLQSAYIDPSKIIRDNNSEE